MVNQTYTKMMHCFIISSPQLSFLPLSFLLVFHFTCLLTTVSSYHHVSRFFAISFRPTTYMITSINQTKFDFCPNWFNICFWLWSDRKREMDELVLSWTAFLYLAWRTSGLHDFQMRLFGGGLCFLFCVFRFIWQTSSLFCVMHFFSPVILAFLTCLRSQLLVEL